MLTNSDKKTRLLSLSHFQQNSTRHTKNQGSLPIHRQKCTQWKLSLKGPRCWAKSTIINTFEEPNKIMFTELKKSTRTENISRDVEITKKTTRDSGVGKHSNWHKHSQDRPNSRRELVWAGIRISELGRSINYYPIWRTEREGGKMKRASEACGRPSIISTYV